jgi:hypothetical protein
MTNPSWSGLRAATKDETESLTKRIRKAFSEMSPEKQELFSEFFMRTMVMTAAPSGADEGALRDFEAKRRVGLSMLNLVSTPDANRADPIQRNAG